MKTQDPTAALQTAQDAIAQAGARLAVLAAERTAKLQAPGDYLDQVSRIDSEISRIQAGIQTHEARVAVLREQQREQERARRAEQRVSAIEAIRKLLPRRRETAQKLDTSLKLVAQYYAELDAAEDAIFANWPDVLPPASRFAYLRILRSEPLSTMRKERWAAGIVHDLARRDPDNFAMRTSELSNELLQELEGAQLEEVAVA